MIQSIGIVGYGQFGKFIHGLCETHAPDVEVHISTRDAGKDALKNACQADIVFPCVPMRYMLDVLPDIVENLGEQSIIREVCTVKSFILEELRQYDGIRYLCTHPMFGPESYHKKGNSLEGLTMVICEHTLEDEIYNLYQQTLRDVGIHIVHMTTDEHDKKLAQTLFLTHYISQLIIQSGYERTDIDTVSFGYLMDAVESVKDNKELFHDVRELNPYCKQVVDTLKKQQHILKM